MQVLILGGGVVGLASALALRARGAAVTVVEPGPIPHPDAASTDLNKAVRSDYGADDFYYDLMDAAFAGWARWNETLGAPVFHRVGMLFLTRGPLEPGGLEAESLPRLEARGVAVERMGSTRLRARFPAWAADVYTDGYLNPSAGYAESGRCVALLAAACAEAGVALEVGAAAASLTEDGGRVTGAVLTDGRRLRADLTIVATGAWTPSLLPHLAPMMRPTAQTVMVFAPADPRPFHAPVFPVWAADISRTGWYGFPATADGHVKVAHHGVGRAQDPRAPRLAPDGEAARFRRFLAESLPGLADAPLVQARQCLYCDTPDGDFLLDFDPQHPGLFVAAGGSGHLFKFAPAVGEIVAERALGGDPALGARFRWRAPQARREAARSVAEA